MEGVVVGEGQESREERRLFWEMKGGGTELSLG